MPTIQEVIDEQMKKFNGRDSLTPDDVSSLLKPIVNVIDESNKKLETYMKSEQQAFATRFNLKETYPYDSELVPNTPFTYKELRERAIASRDEASIKFYLKRGEGADNATPSGGSTARDTPNIGDKKTLTDDEMNESLSQLMNGQITEEEYAKRTGAPA